jgi:hypothetical protein
MRSRSDGAGGNRAISGFLDYRRSVVVILMLAAAVAGGELAVTTGPPHPRVGHKVYAYATGEVGSSGRLYVYRNTASACAATARGERRRGTLLASYSLKGSFDYTISYTPRRVRREWVCSYLYGTTCDAAGNNCGIPTGLPPDAGFSQNVVRVRPASQSVKSAAVRGRVIT